MEASGAIIPSICSSMTRSNHHAGFSENPPSHAVKDIFTGIFQLIQLRNLGTKYWVQWCSQKVWVWGKVLGLVTLGWERGYYLLNMLEG